MNVWKIARWVANSVDPDQTPWICFFRIQRVSTVIWSNRTHSEITLDPPLNSPIRCFCLLTESLDTLHRICERTAKAMLIQIRFASGMRRQIWTFWKSPFYHGNGQMKSLQFNAPIHLLLSYFQTCVRTFWAICTTIESSVKSPDQ